MDPLTLKYRPDVDDLIELTALSPSWRRRRIRALSITAAYMAALLAITLDDVGRHGAKSSAVDTWLISGCLITFFAVGLPALVRTSRRALAKGVRKAMKKTPDLLSVREKTITPEGLTTRTAEQCLTVAWSYFTQVRETDRQFILVTPRPRAWVSLPKRALPSPELISQCRQMLQHYVEVGNQVREDPTPASG